MKMEPGFFDFAAEVGLTKHIGGVEATDALVELCHISEGTYVLDVGCGVGVTPIYIAKKYGCRVVGVDINENMVARSKERANREKVSDRAEFRIADAQSLPFEDGLFDAVITESVTAFPEDKQKAVNEYVRVMKQGGYVGLNETTWLKVPPPPEVVAWVGQDLGGNAEPLSSDAWAGLLQAAGLRDIVAKTYAIKVQDEAKALLRRYGLGGMLGIWGRIILLYARSPHYRKFVKEVGKTGVLPENLEEYIGYGLFIGRK